MDSFQYLSQEPLMRSKFRLECVIGDSAKAKAVFDRLVRMGWEMGDIEKEQDNYIAPSSWSVTENGIVFYASEPSAVEAFLTDLEVAEKANGL